jgi:hypothetical protein
MDARAIARATGKIAIALLRFLALGMRRVLLSVLILYWTIFIGYTVTKYFQGGLVWVLAWYAHISSNSSNIFEPWNWKRFVIQQIFALVLTIALSHSEWRRPRLEDRVRAARL